MVSVLKVEITNKDLLDKYAAIIKAQAKATGDDSKKSKVTEAEKAIAETLFKGTTTTSTSGGISAPDWFTSDSVMVSLMKSIAGYQVLNSKKFTDWVDKKLDKDQESVSIEGKLLQTTKEKDGGIKIGELTVAPNKTEKDLASPIKSFGISSNESDIIDTTRYNIIEDLRTSWSGASNKFYKEGTSDERTELSSKALNKGKLSAFSANLGNNISRDLQTFLMKDNTFIKLYGTLENIRLGKETLDANRENISMWVDTLNDRYIRDGFLHELNIMQKEDKLFQHILNTPSVRNQFYMKSRNLAIFRKTATSINGLMLTFSPSDFNSKFFGAKYDASSKAISVYLKSDVEQQFLKQYPEAAAVIRMGQNITEFEKALEKLAYNNKPDTFNYLDEKITYLIPTGGSIPMSKAYLRFATETKLSDPANFMSKHSQELPTKYAAASNASMGTFLSSEYLRLEVIKHIVNKMPEGIPGGPPPPVPNILTYRTGRFANSIQLMVDYRRKLVTYYYNPIYYIHEQTTRDPKVLIKSSINEVLRSRFKQQFNISEMGRF